MTSNVSHQINSNVLATDLDGTFIPLEGNEQNSVDLITLTGELKEVDAQLVYITGRHLEYGQQAIDEHDLPIPDWFICDVGTSVYQSNNSGTFQLVREYERHLEQIISTLPIANLRELLLPVDGLRLQEPAKQGPFKLSFYADASRLNALVNEINSLLDKHQGPYSIVSSIDPFNGDGLIDLLPKDVSKAHALTWWAERQNVQKEEIIFAGDSGNDLAAMSAGYRTIVVGNADRKIAQQAYLAHQQAGWHNRIYLAQGPATTGVLEGCRWFELIPPGDMPYGNTVGATPVSYNTTHFCVWAPDRKKVTLLLETAGRTGEYELKRLGDGYFSATISGAKPGDQYSYLLDEQPKSLPDPRSRYQPDGVHGPSQVVDSQVFPWTDQEYVGVAKQDLIIYELHVGTFTAGGTFQSAIQRLPQLLELGITAVEIMPVAQSPGRWNWGYDGVGLYAVRNTYGTPNDFKEFVDTCHNLGLAVLLDVVYNHLGPEGNYLSEFGPYFSGKHHTPWGDAFNFDDRHSEHVRQFILDNVILWIDEYHLDGLRLDAVHFMFDDSNPTILQEIGATVAKKRNQCGRHIHLIAESNVYDQELLTPSNSSSGYDAIWSDCLMHSIYSHAVPELRLTDREYRGTNDIAEALRYAYLYTGSHSGRKRVKRRNPIGELRERQNDRQQTTQFEYISSLIMALQTHDVVGNHPLGSRVHHLASTSFQKSAVALLLLYPGIPMVFMGEEVAADNPFPFFVDFEDQQLRDIVDQGRVKEYPQHDWQGALLPSSPQAFQKAVCDVEGQHDHSVFEWYQSLISLRKQGISDGWLTASSLTTSHDLENNIFSILYRRDGGGTITIRARLTAAKNRSEKSVSVRISGDVALNSEADHSPVDGRIEMQPNHAVVSMT